MTNYTFVISAFYSLDTLIILYHIVAGNNFNFVAGLFSPSLLPFPSRSLRD